MYIGELARRTGATPKAIRLYESLGLLGKVSRQGAYRIYGERQVQLVLLIRQAQALGFKLSELGAMWSTRHDSLDWAVLLEQLERKRASVGRQIEALTLLDGQLAQAVDEIRTRLAGQPLAACACPAMDEALTEFPPLPA